MIGRLTISFTTEEREALCAMAEEDCRPPKDQLRFLLRQEMKRRELLQIVALSVEKQAPDI